MTGNTSTSSGVVRAAYWGAPLWSAEARGSATIWSVEEDERLSRSVREYGVDDWNRLGDWSEVSGLAVLEPRYNPIKIP